MDVEIGQLLDKKYKIVRLLGEGGMGAVYEGENIRIHHRVAIKVLHPSVAADSGARERFEREAQAAGHIGSEHIVEVFDLGELPSGARYMVMEFLAGEPLSRRVESVGRLTPAAVSPLMLQLLDGLGAAHVAGIVHRDLKPENVFLQRTKAGGDFVKIVDFGVSKFNSLSGGTPMSMTRTGAVVGTPYYMSPEQVKGQKNIDHRSDLYSAGVVLFECVTGQLPFQAESFNELMFKIALEAPLDPEAAVPGLDPWFARILRKATAREMTDRYQSAAEFSQAIAEWMQAANVAALAPGAGPNYPAALPFHGGLPVQTPTGVSAVNVGGIAPGTPTGVPAMSVLRGGGTIALEKTTASGSVLIRTPEPKRRSSGVVAGVAVAALVVGATVAVGLARGSKGEKSPAAAPSAIASVPAAAEPPARSVDVAPPAVVAPPSAAETAAALAPVPDPVAPPAASSSAATDPSAHPTGANHAPVPPTHHVGPPAPPVVAPPSASANSTTVKGRTIRTEL